jgi:hypothetical protein
VAIPLRCGPLGLAAFVVLRSLYSGCNPGELSIILIESIVGKNHSLFFASRHPLVSSPVAIGISIRANGTDVSSFVNKMIIPNPDPRTILNT